MSNLTLWFKSSVVLFFAVLTASIYAAPYFFGMEHERHFTYIPRAGYSEQPWKCPKCGLKNPQGVRFCSRCNWPD